MARKKQTEEIKETEIIKKPEPKRVKATVLVEWNFGKGLIPAGESVMLGEKAYEFYKYQKIVK